MSDRFELEVGPKGAVILTRELLKHLGATVGSVLTVEKDSDGALIVKAHKGDQETAEH